MIGFVGMRRFLVPFDKLVEIVTTDRSPMRILVNFFTITDIGMKEFIRLNMTRLVRFRVFQLISLVAMELFVSFKFMNRRAHVGIGTLRIVKIFIS